LHPSRLQSLLTGIAKTADSTIGHSSIGDLLIRSFAIGHLVIGDLLIRSLVIHFPLRAGNYATENANNLVAFPVKAVGFPNIANLGGLAKTQPEAGFASFLATNAKVVKKIAATRGAVGFFQVGPDRGGRPNKLPPNFNGIQSARESSHQANDPHGKLKHAFVNVVARSHRLAQHPFLQIIHLANLPADSILIDNHRSLPIGNLSLAIGNC